MTYDIHESEEVILHVLLAVKSNHRVINPQQDFNVVVVLPCVSAPSAPDSLVDLPGYRVESPRYIQLWFCTGIRTRGDTSVNVDVQKLEFLKVAKLFLNFSL